MAARSFPGQLRVLPATDPDTLERCNSRELRARFLIDSLFQPECLQLVYSDQDRLIVGSAVPGADTITLDVSRALRAAYFTERRELGVINLGGPGLIEVEGTPYELPGRDGLYIGRGNPSVSFASQNSRDPAAFYIVSYPAHVSYPVTVIRQRDAERLQLGDAATANRRNLYKYIHPAGVRSCQLVMGLTELMTGSVWNTMPVHTHQRRSEIYLYFDLPEKAVVLHCLGLPGETRHLMVRNRQAVLSPSWSIHAGAGTSNYSFVWAMGGENQDFSDQDPVAMEDLA
ncbi:MAG: 5-dehydro-4-deoxy-D-glucuronate isomerase [Acidobacteria bacterium]|nr:MAG: 5-dehydro-4-deoxy-D-glucuronate isomerase [Acidobacteriota bacterium]